MTWEGGGKGAGEVVLFYRGEEISKRRNAFPMVH